MLWSSRAPLSLATRVATKLVLLSYRRPSLDSVEVLLVKTQQHKPTRQFHIPKRNIRHTYKPFFPLFFSLFPSRFCYLVLFVLLFSFIFILLCTTRHGNFNFVHKRRHNCSSTWSCGTSCELVQAYRPKCCPQRMPQYEVATRTSCGYIV